MTIKAQPFICGKHYELAKGKANAKVKNAKKIVIDDIIFKSILEGYVYYRLKQLGIYARYEDKQDRLILIKPFEFQNEKIRAATYMPDFTNDYFIIECKGFKTDAWNIREKLAKRRIAKDYKNKRYFIITSRKGFEEIVPEIQKICQEYGQQKTERKCTQCTSEGMTHSRKIA